jgi:DNA (cytosine-5)-methyltransferase 1
MTTFASLFSGFGGADLAAIAAGLNPIWAVEYEADIAAVYRDNLGDHVTVADILTLDPKDFERPDFLHASPPCPNFSNAKANGEETEHDIALAQKVADFVTVLLPDFFTLENVYQYRESKS